jgi:hypothetical protein
MATGSAAKSNTFRSRAMMDGNAESLGNRTVARSAFLSAGWTATSLVRSGHSLS